MIKPTARILSTAEEVAPRVDAIIRLWDDPSFYDDLCRRARIEAERWAADVLGSDSERFFKSLRPNMVSWKTS